MTDDLLVVDSLHGLVRAEPLGPTADARPAPASKEALIERLATWQQDFIAGMSAATVRAVRADWAQYIAWCERMAQPPLPAPVERLEAFVRDAVVQGRKRTTVQRYVYTVGLVHTAAGLPSPAKDPRWRAKWKGLLKEMKSRGQVTATQAGALERDDVRTILASLATSPRDLRDAAMLALASDTLLRESELVTVRVEHFAYNRTRDAWTLHVPFSKANQDGQEADFRFVSRDARARIETWLDAAGITAGYVFLPIGGRPKAPKAPKLDPDDVLLVTSAPAQRASDGPLLPALPAEEEPKPLAAKEVARIFRRRALAAGLDHAPTISGHSTRIGTANDLINAGKTTAQIQLAGGWRSAEMVTLYTRRSQAGANAVAELAATEAPLPPPRRDE